MVQVSNVSLFILDPFTNGLSIKDDQGLVWSPYSKRWSAYACKGLDTLENTGISASTSPQKPQFDYR